MAQKLNLAIHALNRLGYDTSKLMKSQMAFLKDPVNVAVANSFGVVVAAALHFVLNALA